jgi:hypothetical protein
MFGSADKELIGAAGPHGETRPATVVYWREFVRRTMA